jgi:hypothetical protein
LPIRTLRSPAARAAASARSACWTDVHGKSDMKN